MTRLTFALEASVQSLCLLELHVPPSQERLREGVLRSLCRHFFSFFFSSHRTQRLGAQKAGRSSVLATMMSAAVSQRGVFRAKSRAECPGRRCHR